MSWPNCGAWLRRLKMENNEFKKLKQSIKEAVAISQGKLQPARRISYGPDELHAIREGRGQDVKAIRLKAKQADDTPPTDIKVLRQKLELSQSEFARLIQVNVRTLQNWEQGHRHPTGPAAALLKIVASSPEAALKVLGR